MLLSFVLFYMVEKMTHPVQDDFYDISLKRNVPFFVYLSNCKIIIEQYERTQSNSA